VQVLLVDTAGRRESADPLEQVSQALGKDQAADADLVLLCQEAGQGVHVGQSGDRRAQVLQVATKCDCAEPSPDSWATSAMTGIGLEELRQELARQALSRKQSALAPSLSRCRHHIDACLLHLRHAHGLVLNEDPAELLAVEVRGALDELGAMVGAVYTDDLLDRIFSRFCIGK
jgi:tRNA modification GTPase